uniref:Uncharacterized protein n=1 Tax=Helianthus annuus TaxID=4232 RepID=A0A251STL8_HELAN
MAYSSVHGRYFTGKQEFQHNARPVQDLNGRTVTQFEDRVKCEFVSLTRWKVAICWEYMKARLKVSQSIN